MFFIITDYSEEARKMWQNQEVRWNAEQEARNHLMRDVLITIQKQVKHSKLLISVSNEKGINFEYFLYALRICCPSFNFIDLGERKTSEKCRKTYSIDK